MPLIFDNFERLRLLGRVNFIEIDGKVFAYNVRDSYLVEISAPERFASEIIRVVSPPVKTLILHTTYQCNLNCKHCYLNAGNEKQDEMSSKELCRVVSEFGDMGGLGVDLSGEEALLKEGIEDVVETAREKKLRTVVLSNAVDLDPIQLRRIAPYVDGIAVGLDGLYDSNDAIRGKGSFKRTVVGLERIAEAGIELSLTTLITPESIPQLAQFPEFISRYGGRSWSLVMPMPSGRFAGKEDNINEAIRLWEEAKRKGILKEIHAQSRKSNVTVIIDHILVPSAKRRVEETARDFVYEAYNKGRACWDNTLTIMPNGDVKCCLFFDGQVYENIRNKALKEVYKSSRRESALAEFKKYPVDKCPFVEKHQLEKFERGLNV